MPHATGDDTRRAVQLATFLTEFRSSSLSPARIEKAKAHILDTIACGVGGACAAEARSTLTMLRDCAEIGQAPVWGHTVGLTPRAAAFCNAVATHSFELDDTMGCDHSGTVVIPAAISALSLAARPVTGAEFITAVVLGYEVAKRVMEALGGYWPHNRAGWHSTATCGPFGAAAAAGRILGLKQPDMASALGHAASFSGGLWAFIHDASQTKRIHAGRAAEGGLTAALLARAGVSGPKSIFEDVWGSFLGAFAPSGHDAARITAGLGDRWEFDLAAIKPYASCRGTHSTLDAIQTIMREHLVGPGDIVDVDIVVPPGLLEMCGGRDTSNLAAAQMSLPYAVTAFLERGDLGIFAFSQASRSSRSLLDRMRRVNVAADARLDALAEPTVQVRCRSGRSFQAHVDPPLGSPGNPLPEARLRAKAMELLTMALSSARASALVESLGRLEAMADVRALPSLLSAETPPPAFD